MFQTPGPPGEKGVLRSVRVFGTFQDLVPVATATLGASANRTVHTLSSLVGTTLEMTQPLVR